MRYEEILQTFAEVAVAFAGFASLISLLGRSSEFLDGSATTRDGSRTSLLVTAFALFPFVAPCGWYFRARGAWRLSAILLVAVSGTTHVLHLAAALPSLGQRTLEGPCGLLHIPRWRNAPDLGVGCSHGWLPRTFSRAVPR